MHRPAQILTIAAATTAFTALLVSRAGQLTPATLAAAIGLMLLAAATTVHAVIRPADRGTTDEAYIHGFTRVSYRLSRSRHRLTRSR
jgi:hypothetical protein